MRCSATARWLCYDVVTWCMFSVASRAIVFFLVLPIPMPVLPHRMHCLLLRSDYFSHGVFFNWQIEWISLTTGLSSHGTRLYLAQWVEFTCHLRGQPANSVSLSLSLSQVQMHSHKCFLSSSLSSSFLFFLLCFVEYVRSYSQPINTNLLIKSRYNHCRLADRHDY